MNTIRSLVVCLLMATPAFAATAPKIVNAADGIFVAFQNHPVVGLGEWHGLSQELDFYAALVRDPRFAREVGNIVLETGSAAQQAVVDRYVNGENVSYTELRRVWADTVGMFPTVLDLGAINLYASVRSVNLSLPPNSRIKVWLGDPPINWPQVKTKDEWQVLENQRDSHPAALIEREILDKGKKALVIYGEGHFGKYPDGLALSSPVVTQRSLNIRARLDNRHPGALYVISPYLGYTTASCAEKFERNFPGIPAPSLISPVKGSTLEADVASPGCYPITKVPQITQEEFELSAHQFAGLDSDAILYLGPRKSLTESPDVPDLYLDSEFRAEMDRRLRLRLGNGLKAIPDPWGNPAVNQPMFEN
jgi:hypothetical protein